MHGLALNEWAQFRPQRFVGHEVDLTIKEIFHRASTIIGVQAVDPLPDDPAIQALRLSGCRGHPADPRRPAVARAR